MELNTHFQGFMNVYVLKDKKFYQLKALAQVRVIL
jgi:hypothetical protein